VAHLAAPGLHTASEQLAHLGALVACARTATRPPLHRRHDWRTGLAQHEQAQPVQARDTDPSVLI